MEIFRDLFSADTKYLGNARVCPKLSRRHRTRQHRQDASPSCNSDKYVLLIRNDYT